MRVALVTDIHGNLLALDAALAEIQRHGVDQIICLGDVAALGPQPLQVLERLRQLDCPCILGNHDEHMLKPEMIKNEPHPWLQEVSYWCREQLTPADFDYLRSYLPLLEVPLDDSKTMLCCHGSPRSNNEGIRANTLDEALDAMLVDQTADILVCGHTHTPLLRLHYGRLIVNIGSTGYPIRYPWPRGDNAQLHPWVEYAIITSENSHIDISLRRCNYDRERGKQIALTSGMPGADFWISSWIS